MSVIFRIYRDAALKDQDLGEQLAFTVGSGKKDQVQIEDCGLGKKQLSFTREEKVWSWTSAKPVQTREGTLSQGKMAPGRCSGAGSGQADCGDGAGAGRK